MSEPALASGNSYQANLYPAVEQQGATSPVGAVCFSGGGSRALTCALGQLSALSSPTGPNQESLLQNFSFISSVSGGSWASVLYTFLPPGFSDAEFLISPPRQLPLHKAECKACRQIALAAYRSSSAWSVYLTSFISFTNGASLMYWAQTCGVGFGSLAWANLS